MNQKGQSGAVFKLLIGSVIGIIIIGIIYTLIVQIESQKNILDEEIYLKKIEMAIKNPTGQPYTIKNVKVSKTGAITAAFLSERTGLNKNCFKFECETKQNYFCTENGIFIQKPTTFDLTITCELIEGNEECGIECKLEVK